MNFFQKKEAENENIIKGTTILKQKTSNQSKKKIILVRDFDKVLESDRGFQQKIIEYTIKSKNPLILLCGIS